MSIRSLAAVLAASILEQGLHMEPVTSSMSATSTLLPPLPLLVQAALGHSAAVAVVVMLTQPKPLPWHPAGAPGWEPCSVNILRTLKNGVLTQELAVTVNAVLSALGENCSVDVTTSLGLA